MTLVELDSSLIAKAMTSIEKNLGRVGRKILSDDQKKVAQYVEDAMGRIIGSTDLMATVKQTDLVIEAIVENLAAKQKLFSSIDEVSCRSNKF